MAVRTAKAAEPAQPAGLKALIQRYSAQNAVPYGLADAIIRIESRYNAGARNGPHMGLTQIHTATARSLGYAGEAAGLLDAETNIRYGLKYIATRLSAGGRRHLRDDPALSGGATGPDHDRSRPQVLRPRQDHHRRDRMTGSALTGPPFCTTSARQPAGRPLRASLGEESPGSMEARCRITSGGG